MRKVTTYEAMLAIAFGRKLYELQEVTSKYLMIENIVGAEYVMEDHDLDAIKEITLQQAEAYRQEKDNPEEPEKPEKPEKPEEPQAPTKEGEPAPKKRIDWGKVKALHNAGWTVKQIAKEMDISEGTIRNRQTEMRKRRAAPPTEEQK